MNTGLQAEFGQVPRGRAKPAGFTLIELVIVIVLLGLLAAVAVPRFVDLSDEATDAAVQSQAAALITQDTLNVAACRTGSSECIDIQTTGAQACEESLAAFFPQLDRSAYTVRNISSRTPEDDWSSQLQQGEALYWVTRFLTSEPDEAWLAAGWNVRQPCVLGANTGGG